VGGSNFLAVQKIVINSKYGGFGLSKKAYTEIAKRLGKQSFFFGIKFDVENDDKYYPVSAENEDETPLGIFIAFDTPEPPQPPPRDEWHRLSIEERQEINRRTTEREIPSFKDDRSNPVLVEVVEMLGDEASGKFSSLKVVEIPDGVDWEIEEYDGREWISEKHKSWS
jgi:hypothetical protein